MNDSQAIHYDQFFCPLFFEPFALEIAKRIDSQQVSTVLEIAAGTGRVTRHTRELISKSAKLIASDMNPHPLLSEEETRELLAGNCNQYRRPMNRSTKSWCTSLSNTMNRPGNLWLTIPIRFKSP